MKVIDTPRGILVEVGVYEEIERLAREAGRPMAVIVAEIVDAAIVERLRRRAEAERRAQSAACPRCKNNEVPRPIKTAGALPGEWWCARTLGGCGHRWQRRGRKR